MQRSLITKKMAIVLMFVVACCLPFVSKSQQSSYKIKTIVIDAGHGGKDAGANGSRSLEKNIALEVAIKLAKNIEKELPGVKVILTRKTDVFIDLYKRIDIANDNNADLFISIHCNSGGESVVRRKNAKGKYVSTRVLNTSARGTETLVAGSHRLGEQDAAIRENASIYLEENYEENYGGLDPKDPESYIIFSLVKNQFRDQSIKLANLMQSEYVSAGRISRGVWEKGLAVLQKAGMPAVLTEIGFISNPEEESFMMSDAGQAEIVTNLTNAIKSYKKSIER